MHKERINLGGLTLIGLSTRTNNKNEMNPATSKIASLAGTYWSQQVANEFKGRLNPGITYSVYTDYESDEHGEYTYFIGEIVESLENQDLSKFETLVIPPSDYQRFTTKPGKFPEIVISAWQAIWKMTPTELAGKRKYIADFEVYDQRASDPNSAVIDIYIGIAGI